MNVLFLSMVYFDTVEQSGIYSDLMRKFRSEGHRLYIMTPIERRYKTDGIKEEKEGVTFLKVKTGNLMNVNLIEKGVSTLMVERSFIKAVKRYLADVTFDLILYTTPPITFSNVVHFLKKRDQAKTYLLLKDIFPQNAVDLNMFSERSPLYWYFRQKEKQLYQVSDHIGCMSPANVDYVLKHNDDIEPEKVEVCPNTIMPHPMVSSVESKLAIRQRYHLPLDKTIFMYGGNLGKPQGIDFLIQCLKANEQHNDSFILVVGAGTEFNKLTYYFKAHQPKKARLLANLPKQDYEELLNSCDVGLIFLDKRFTIPNFPSRLLSYMQAAKPVIAAIDTATDIGQVIERGEFGFSCVSGDEVTFSRLVKQLCSTDLRQQLGQNARHYLEKNYTSDHSYEIIMNHFQ